ncbi:MAG TPA: iron-containing alcohol dehydrogenase [Candidatus Brocadiia bacterium]|nr:iron-containing alcohol dehydrogenase [Candidatus Brocadiia bacterium]
MSEITSFSFPTQIRFGPGARSAVAEFAASCGVKRPLMVADAGLPKTEAYKLMSAELSGTWPAGFAAFTGVNPNPTEDNLEDTFRAYADGKCDGVIGVGGGSALDVAKAVRIKIAFPDRSFAKVSRDMLPKKLAPFCAVPTTAGTGSEVGRSSVITVPSLGLKVVVGGPPLLADMAILDAELTVGLPPFLTAATGMDAMTHAVESFVCPCFHPMCDAIALEAVRMTRIYLPKAWANGKDLEARGMMLMAAAMGAVAFQKDLGVAHSLSHPLSTDFGVHHGLANAIALPATVRFNGEENSGQYERVAVALGVAPGNDPAGAVADFLDGFNKSIGITQKLRDLKVPQNALEGLAEKAMLDGCHPTNPRKCEKKDMLRLYKEIW